MLSKQQSKTLTDQIDLFAALNNSGVGFSYSQRNFIKTQLAALQSIKATVDEYTKYQEAMQ